MIHMDIDTHSSSSLRQRLASAKRARSPEPPSPLERPAKRLSLAIRHTNGYPSLDVRKRLSDNSAGSSRQSSEDWVQQTGGLSIDSPVYAGSTFSSDLEDVERRKDEDMMVEVIDYSQQTRDIQTERPQLPLLQTSPYIPFTSGQPLNLEVSGLNQPPIPSITPHPAEYAPFQVVSHLAESDQLHHRHPVLGLNSVMGPSINVVPPTPMEHQDIHHHHTSLPLDLGSGISSQETIVPSSPRPSMPRKQRFAMGPRADCEKCRMGIKGHFVHLE